MKKLYFALPLALFYCNLFSQITYVNSAASGLNDGSSWENAFTDLEDALEKFNGQSIFTQESIWVAAGTYKPGGSNPDTSSSFLIDFEGDLYGGFNGTETDISQRDMVQNPTILSGDFNDDDGSTIDSMLRVENARHVILVTSNIDRVITIDGFTIEGGNTSENGDDEFLNRAGGGILSFAPINIYNCIFQNNFGRSGAGAAIVGGASGNSDALIEVRNCSFSSNEATAQSAGIVIYEMGNVIVSDCSFSDNQTNRGCLYPNTCGNFEVSNCTFENNTNDNFGGGMFVWQTMNLSIDNCRFARNRARSAAGMYYDTQNIISEGPSLTITNSEFIENDATDGVGGGFTLFQATNVTVDNCRFSGNVTNSGSGMYINGSGSPKNANHINISNCEFSSNEARERGGGFFSFAASYTMEDCTFLSNSGGSSSGGIHNTGANKSCIIRRCIFGNNISPFGGGATNYGDSTLVMIEDCDFLLNEAETSGGALLCGFNAETHLMNSEMKNCNARFGGAISIQNDSTSLYIMNSNLEDNAASSNGGAINGVSGFNYVNIENSTFSKNTADFGGVIHVSGVDTVETVLDTSFLLITNSIFNDNMAENQGGAINIINKNARLENCLIYGNTANGAGTGGAISHNATNMADIELALVNCTIADNLGLISSGVAGFTDEMGQGKITAINTIFRNLSDFRIEDGTPEFVSLGGNISRDAFMVNFLGLTDIIGVDASFVDEFSFDYRITEDSPCRDAGVPGGTTMDILGFERDDNPDIGAYEWRLMSTIDDPVYTDNISVYPNPSASLLNIKIDDNFTEADFVTIYNTLGEKIKTVKTEKSNVDISFLENGLYHLLVIEKGKKHVVSFMKIY